MKYIVDFKNSTSDEIIDTWLSENNYQIVHTFNHFEKMYLVETDGPIALADFIEYAHLDDHSTAIKLHTSPELLEINTMEDDDWWKTISIYGTLDNDSDVVKVVRRGKGYAVYLMDSGVNDAHADFANATIRHLFSHTNTPNDLNGHGTALASIIAGERAGLTSAEVVSVKIFEQGVPTLVSDIMKALDAVALDYLDKYLGKPAIVNMSWSIDRNEFVEDKIRSLIKIGLLPVVAAGNSGIPIENVTPAAMAEVATIGSIGPDLTPSDFSDYTGPTDISFTAGQTNYAPGLDYWAPGEYILVANESGGFTHIAGTSAAAAVVSATLVCQFSRISLEYGKVYRQPLYSFADEFNSKIHIEATIETLSKELIMPYGSNPFIHSRILVELTEKYHNCTNRVPGTLAIYDEDFTNSFPLTWFMDEVIIKNRALFNRTIYDPVQVDSASVSGLPEGIELNLETGMLSGTFNIDMGEDKLKTFNVEVLFTRGEKTIEDSLQIIIVDDSFITEEFTEDDYQDLLINSDIELKSGQCTRCPPRTSVNCPGAGTSCVDCAICSDYKTSLQLCLNFGNTC